MSSDALKLFDDGLELKELHSDAITDSNRFEIAIRLFSAGYSLSSIKQLCCFKSVAEVRRFTASAECREAIAILRQDRKEMIGERALVRLSEALSPGSSLDSRALISAIRTGLEVSGQLNGSLVGPLKRVADLSVAELRAMIDTTKRELEGREYPAADGLPIKE